MEVGCSDLFRSYEMELETHVHVQIEKKNYGFINTKLHATTMVDKLVDGTRV